MKKISCVIFLIALLLIKCSIAEKLVYTDSFKSSGALYFYEAPDGQKEGEQIIEGANCKKYKVVSKENIKGTIEPSKVPEGTVYLIVKIEENDESNKCLLPTPQIYGDEIKMDFEFSDFFNYYSEKTGPLEDFNFHSGTSFFKKVWSWATSGIGLVFTICIILIIVIVVVLYVRSTIKKVKKEKEDNPYVETSRQDISFNNVKDNNPLSPNSYGNGSSFSLLSNKNNNNEKKDGLPVKEFINDNFDEKRFNIGEPNLPNQIGNINDGINNDDGHTSFMKSPKQMNENKFSNQSGMLQIDSTPMSPNNSYNNTSNIMSPNNSYNNTSNIMSPNMSIHNSFNNGMNSNMKMNNSFNNSMNIMSPNMSMNNGYNNNGYDNNGSGMNPNMSMNNGYNNGYNNNGNGMNPNMSMNNGYNNGNGMNPNMSMNNGYNNGYDNNVNGMNPNMSINNSFNNMNDNINDYNNSMNMNESISKSSYDNSVDYSNSQYENLLSKDQKPKPMNVFSKEEGNPKRTSSLILDDENKEKLANIINSNIYDSDEEVGNKINDYSLLNDNNDNDEKIVDEDEDQKIYDSIPPMYRDLKTFRVFYPFKPHRDDELTIECGHLLKILKTFEDGWILGYNIMTTEKGFIPRNKIRLAEDFDRKIRRNQNRYIQEKENKNKSFGNPISPISQIKNLKNKRNLEVKRNDNSVRVENSGLSSNSIRVVIENNNNDIINTKSDDEASDQITPNIPPAPSNYKSIPKKFEQDSQSLQSDSTNEIYNQSMSSQSSQNQDQRNMKNNKKQIPIGIDTSIKNNNRQQEDNIYDNPRTPKYDEPRTPNYDNPRTPRTPKYDNPRTPKYDEPRTPKYDNPRTPRNDEPRTPKYDNPRTPRSENPRTPRNDEPRTPKYDNPRTPRNDDPRTPRYDEPRTPKYDNPRTPRSDNPRTPRNDDPRTPKYDNPRTPKYDDPRTPRYDDPRTPKYDDPRTPRYDDPRTPRYDDPRTPRNDDPRTPRYDEPRTPKYDNPRTPRSEERYSNEKQVPNNPKTVYRARSSSISKDKFNPELYRLGSKSSSNTNSNSRNPSKYSYGSKTNSINSHGNDTLNKIKTEPYSNRTQNKYKYI